MTLRISLIAALADNRVIGDSNRLLWHIPEDFRHFKATTMGKPVVMGRKTYDSIGKPLPGRANIVITRNPAWGADGVTAVPSLEQAFEIAKKNGADEVFVIGGAQVYAQALPFATTLYLSHIHKTFYGDAVFPPLGMQQWRETDRRVGQDCAANGLEYEFVTYQRI